MLHFTFDTKKYPDLRNVIRLETHFFNIMCHSLETEGKNKRKK